MKWKMREREREKWKLGGKISARNEMKWKMREREKWKLVVKFLLA
jgi:hypothetical protein